MNSKLKTPWEDEKAFYNIHAKKFLSTGKFYHAWMIGNTDIDFAQYIIKKIGLKSTDKVVDLGCGSGFLVNEISKICHCIGISTSEEGIKYARSNFPNAEFEVADMQTYVAKNTTHFLSLESIGYVDIDKIFKNVASHLVDEGIFYIKDISVIANPNNDEADNIKYWEDYWHYKGRSIPLMINKGYEHGFKLISCNDLNEDPRRNLEPFYLTLKENELEQKYPHPDILVHIGSEFIFKKVKQKKWNPDILKGSEIL